MTHPRGVTWSGPRLSPPARPDGAAHAGLAARSGKMAVPRAAWDGRDEPWNRLDVPWPANSAAVPLAAQHPAVGLLSALRRRCDIAGKRLSGPGLAAEGRVLRAVLYVYHSRLLRHRPYLALQQVEQCLKRLWKMNLVGCLETLVGLIPKKNASKAQEECLVPSQPILETVALKVLGGCKLILRLLDCCCKAFLLSVKHLCSKEFILLNTVASGLLSRLWVQYRCVLQTLMSLYSVLSTMLQLVSETQKTPYIKGFTFPSDVGDFLGVNVSSEAKKQKAKMLTAKKSTSWMTKFFPAMPEAVSKVGKKRKSETCTSAVKNHSILCPVDIGETVVVPTARRGKHPGFDVKSLLRPSRHPTQEGLSIASTPLQAKSSPLSSQIVKSQHTGSLVQMVQTAASFGELSEALRKAILWCKTNKFKSEAYFLRNKLLKSKRLHHVEAQGCSLKKKLRCVKTSVCKHLLYGPQHTRWPRQHLQARCCRRRIRSSALLKTAPKTGGQKPPELFGVCENSASLILPAYQDGSPSQEEHCSIDTGRVRLSTTGTPKRLLLEGSPGLVWKEPAENTDIDSIFAAIGV
ncbi:LOW QUALITY PROTEIN: nucleolus and neural progenitor protein [Melospiza georgiana]|uniref:LOW QUALITY PROTEIN: nucleolus and neural progenitor protein n=1 Tax=Melospiza georgiana TaxID=44398 RepID=UPI0025AD7313|nr:LOW QUALITY PROTEIN: nucleolus and neural progenitor protein [Melospiza georgiana]